jgi:hypothetical protein
MISELSKQPAVQEKAALSIAEFCDAHSISVPTYYSMRRAGVGPAEMRFGHTVRISREAAAAWRRARENPTGEEARRVESERARLHERSLRAVAAR